MKEHFLFGWSGGKDCALALQTVLEQNRYAITLLTTAAESYRRVSMHGVRLELLKVQANSLALPLEVVHIPTNCSMEEYGILMEKTLTKHLSQGCRGVIFGDIFLEDVRAYREKKMAEVGMQVLFPLWGRSTEELSRKFIRNKFKAITTCIDSQAIDKSFAGRLYDSAFLKELPDHVDPCGENGEFHTFTFDGPIFSQPINFTKGEVVFRDNRFYFCDLLM